MRDAQKLCWLYFWLHWKIYGQTSATPTVNSAYSAMFTHFNCLEWNSPSSSMARQEMPGPGQAGPGRAGPSEYWYIFCFLSFSCIFRAESTRPPPWPTTVIADWCCRCSVHGHNQGNLIICYAAHNFTCKPAVQPASQPARSAVQCRPRMLLVGQEQATNRTLLQIVDLVAKIAI